MVKFEEKKHAKIDNKRKKTAEFICHIKFYFKQYIIKAMLVVHATQLKDGDKAIAKVEKWRFEVSIVVNIIKM